MASPKRSAFAIVLVACSLPGAFSFSLQDSLQEIEDNSSGPIESLMKLERDMISMITTDSTQLGVDMTKAVQSTIDLLEKEVEGSIKKSWQADTQALAKLKAAFDKCASGRKSYTLKISSKTSQEALSYTSLLTCKVGRHDSESVRYRKWQSCEKLLSEETESRTIKCNEFNEVSGKWNVNVDGCRGHGKSPNTYVTWIHWNKDNWKNAIHIYDTKERECVKARAKVKETKDKCKSLKQKWTNKRNSCHSLQKGLELISCRILDNTISVNEFYPNCYNPALSAYQREVVLLRKQESNRNYEYTALARVKCYLNVFTLPEGSKTTELAKCRTTDFSTTKYNLNYWPAPAKLSAMARQPYACQDNFLAKYYENKFDQYAPANKCEWCSAHTPTPPPTPEPTPVPTPFPTPPPTAPPTPPPTLAKGEGCKITFYSKKNFEGKKGTWAFPGTKFVGEKMNDKLQSWKGVGSQCKFCFYKHSNYITSLGNRLAAEVKKLSTKSITEGVDSEETMMKQVSSIRILDMRYTKDCPE